MNFKKINDEVFIAEDAVVCIGDAEIAFLKRQALLSPRRRARICAHKTNGDALHEMLIVIDASSYIHPHRHVAKSESFHIVEGEVDVAIFDSDGKVVNVISLGCAGSGRKFFYRLSESTFHTLLIRSNYLVVHEVTNGPLESDRTVIAPFAPTEDKADEVSLYMAHVADQVSLFLQEKGQ